MKFARGANFAQILHSVKPSPTCIQPPQQQQQLQNFASFLPAHFILQPVLPRCSAIPRVYFCICVCVMIVFVFTVLLLNCAFLHLHLHLYNCFHVRCTNAKRCTHPSRCTQCNLFATFCYWGRGRSGTCNLRRKLRFFGLLCSPLLCWLGFYLIAAPDML